MRREWQEENISKKTQNEKVIIVAYLKVVIMLNWQKNVFYVWR